MKSNQQFTRIWVVFASAALMWACGNQMQPAKNALDNINITLSAVAADAQKYVPEQLAQVQSKVAGLNSSYQSKDYASVVAGAPAVLSSISDLGSAAAAKKDEIAKALGNQWREMAASVPQSLSAVQSRVADLSNGKHVPKDIDLSAGKNDLGTASAAWDQAQSAFKAGNPEGAVAAAKEAKDALAAAASALKVTLS